MADCYSSVPTLAGLVSACLAPAWALLQALPSAQSLALPCFGRLFDVLVIGFGAEPFSAAQAAAAQAAAARAARAAQAAAAGAAAAGAGVQAPVAPPL